MEELEQQEFVGNIWKYIRELVNYTIKRVEEDYKKTISEFNRFLEEGNHLTDSDIASYRRAIHRFESLESLRDKYLEKQTPQAKSLIQNLISQISELDSVFFKRKITSDSISSIVNYLGKVKMMAEFSTELAEKYENSRKEIYNNIQSFMDTIRQLIAAHRFEEAGEAMSTLKLAADNLAIHLEGVKPQNIDSEYKEEKYPQVLTLKVSESKGELSEIILSEKNVYTEIKAYLVEHIKKNLESIETLLSKQKLSDTDIRTIIDALSLLDLAKNSLSLKPHVDAVWINQFGKEKINKIISRYNSIKSEIEKQFEYSETSFPALKQLIGDMQQLRQIPSVEIETNDSYHKTINKLVLHVDKRRTNAEAKLSSFTQEDKQIDYHELASELDTLTQAAWIEQYDEKICKNVIKDIIKEVSKRAHKTLEYIRNKISI